MPITIGKIKVYTNRIGPNLSLGTENFVLVLFLFGRMFMDYILIDEKVE